MDLAKQIDSLLGDFSHLAPRIRHLSYNTSACGDRIDVRCCYVSFRAGQPTLDDFVETLAHHIISFCLPRAEIKTARSKIQQGDHVAASVAMAALTKKAQDLFIKAKKGSHRSGEAGEIALYILNEWQLKAPQIVSKMYLKTNNNMPVHGTDGIHARYDDQSKTLFLYWGESKAHAKLASALGDALASIKKFVEEAHEKREIEIVASYLDFDGMDQASKAAFLEYLDPYSEQSNQRRTVYSCLLIYEEAVPKAAGLSDEALEQSFIQTVNSAVQSFINSIEAAVTAKGLGAARFEFFLLPVPSVQTLRDKFQAKIGWPKQ